MDCCTPGFSVHHQLPELAQAHVHRVSDAIQPSHHLLSPSQFIDLLPSIFPIIMVFSNESTLHIRWPKYWSFSISPSSEYSGLISFRIHWFDMLIVQGTSRVSGLHWFIHLLYSVTEECILCNHISILRNFQG